MKDIPLNDISFLAFTLHQNGNFNVIMLLHYTFYTLYIHLLALIMIYVHSYVSAHIKYTCV